MRRAILVFLVVCLAVVDGLSGQSVEQVANLSAGGGRARNVHPQVLVMKGGDVMVAWESGSSKNNNDIIYRIWKKGINVWHPPLAVAPFVAVKGVRNAQYPQLVEDGDGVVHMSFMDGDASYNRDAYYSYYKDGTWSHAVNVCPTAVNSAWPRISLDMKYKKLYVTWQHSWKNRYDGKDIVYVMKDLGENSWSEMKALSSSSHRQSIHQATVCREGGLRGVWMEGDADRDVWGLQIGWASLISLRRNDWELVRPTAVHQPQWPDLALDSEGSMLGIFSRRDAPLQFIWESTHGIGTEIGFLADGGGITFFGVTVGRNDVAYCMYRRNVGNGFLPVLIRFDGEWVAAPELLEHQAIRPAVWVGHMDVGVSPEGTAHMVWSSGQPSHVPTAIFYARKGRHPEAPEVSIKVFHGLNRNFELQGELVSGNTALRHRCWFVPELGLWKRGEDLELQLPEGQECLVYYVVADENHLFGCAQTVLKPLEFPRLPRQRGLPPLRKDSRD
jgi:hypothetical protein